ncbi:MAG: hypothetical protein WCY09_09980 [Candidatus Omnitrophota bacterium]
MSVNRSIRRAAEKKAAKSGTSPVQLLKGLANLDGVVNLSTKLDEFLVASGKMEAIAEKLDESETLEAIGDVRAVATTLKEQVEGVVERQKIQYDVLLAIIDNLRSTIANPTGLACKDLDYWESKLKEAHGRQ